MRTVLGIAYALVLLGGLSLLWYRPFGDLSPLLFLGCVLAGVVITFFLGPNRTSPETSDPPSP